MIEINWQSKREAMEILIKRDGDRCFICNESFGKKEKRTIDHWIPLSKGGTWDITNLRLAHKKCNIWKGDRVPLADGTIPEPPTKRSQSPKRKVKKQNRPKVCNVCMSGRNLMPGQMCMFCNSGPQPITFPGWAKRKSNECDHTIYHCYACILGFVRRA